MKQRCYLICTLSSYSYTVFLDLIVSHQLLACSCNAYFHVTILLGVFCRILSHIQCEVWWMTSLLFGMSPSLPRPVNASGTVFPFFCKHPSNTYCMPGTTLSSLATQNSHELVSWDRTAQPSWGFIYWITLYSRNCFFLMFMSHPTAKQKSL